MIVKAVAVLFATLSSLLGSPAGGSTVRTLQERADGCVLAIDGHDVRDFAQADNALRLDVNDVVQIDALSVEPTATTRIAIDLPIGPSVPVKTIHHRPGQRFTDSLAIADISDIGVGWYHVEVDSGACDGSFWVRVYGRSPFTTVIGIGAALVLVVGVGLLAVAVLHARRGRSKWWLGALGGLFVGIALCLLAQQFAIVAFTPIALAAFLGGGTVAGAGATSAVGSAAGSATAPATLPAPQPPAPPAAPTSGAAPPSPPPAVTPSSAPPPSGAPPPSPGPPPSPSVAPPSPGPPPSPTLPPPQPAHSDASADVDPPRSSFARIECDEAVVASTPFELLVGLSPTPVDGVVGPALIRPPSSVGDYELTAHVVADGFDLVPGETWRKTMLVSAADPYPHVIFHLVAPEATADHPLAINVLYSVDSQTMGLGVRCVRVVESVAEVAMTSPSPIATTAGSMSAPVADQPADLTVRILRGNEAGRLLWSFESPHVALDEQGTSSIGDDAGGFARTVISTIAAHEGQPTLALGLRGIGLTIAEKVPAEMWAALTAVTDAIRPRRPTVLLLSEEAYVPWELAMMPTPIDKSVIGVLGAQVAIGRWVLAVDHPKLPPPRLVHVEGMIVISGRYDQPGWSRLEAAEAEAAALMADYGAVGIDAVTEKVVGCLTGNPAGDVLHFSLHGKYDPGSAKQGLVLIDGDVIDPLVVKGGSLVRAPLVFLNACQVGTGQETLGDYAGLAESFLFVGAAAVVAPLWSIDDSVASALAERFYAHAFTGESLAEIVRAERAGFDAHQSDHSSTLMAFQFFGHPEMRLERAGIATPSA